MTDIIFTLVFSIVLLFFAIYPAIKITDFIDSKKNLTSFSYNLTTIIFTILIALSGGLFLRFF